MPKHRSAKPEVKLLGHDVPVPASPDKAMLERVANPQPDTNYVPRFTAPEFTSICPVTGQPDFAHLVIDYVPGSWLLESKSLKLYLASFRSHGAFHEDCTVSIGRRIADLIQPRYIRVGGYWYPRGGIPIDVFGRAESYRRISGCPTRAQLLTVAAVEFCGLPQLGRSLPAYLHQ